MIKKAIAYLFGNNIIGTVKLTDEESCVLIEADIKGSVETGYKISINDGAEEYNLIMFPPPCHNGVKISFYIDYFTFFDLCGKWLYIKSCDDIVLAEGSIMRVIYGKRYYSQ